MVLTFVLSAWNNSSGLMFQQITVPHQYNHIFENDYVKLHFKDGPGIQLIKCGDIGSFVTLALVHHYHLYASMYNVCDFGIIYSPNPKYGLKDIIMLFSSASANVAYDAATESTKYVIQAAW